MYEVIRDILSGSEFSVIESFEIHEQSAQYAEIPNFLFSSNVGNYLRNGVGEIEGIWTHQARALKSLGDGANVVVSTGTASGKSLIFRSIALHKILLNPSSRVIVFYPLGLL